jgi:hypothetical protein
VILIYPLYGRTLSTIVTAPECAVVCGSFCV